MSKPAKPPVVMPKPRAVPLLHTRILAEITNDPESFDMYSWCSSSKKAACGTTMCYAGWVAHLAGASIPDLKRLQRSNRNYTLIPKFAKEVLKLSGAPLEENKYGDPVPEMFQTTNSEALDHIRRESRKELRAHSKKVGKLAKVVDASD